MLQRLFVCGLLLYGAAAIDLGLPMWISTPVLPSFLNLLLVMFCQTLRGGELVAWAGAIGLQQDFATGETPGAGIMTAATLALIVACRQASSPQRSTLSDRLLAGMVMLAVLGLVRGIRLAMSVSDFSPVSLASALLIRAAATYLLFVILSCLWSCIRWFTRRSYRLENSCV